MRHLPSTGFPPHLYAPVARFETLEKNKHRFFPRKFHQTSKQRLPISPLIQIQQFLDTAIETLDKQKIQKSTETRFPSRNTVLSYSLQDSIPPRINPHILSSTTFHYRSSVGQYSFR